MRRTDSGITNEHLFYPSVEAVVYVEGGLDSQVNDRGRIAPSPDVSFWQGLFQHFIPDRRFRFKARGGRALLEEIADDIAAGRILSTIVCLDRDRSHLTGLKDHIGVLYTFGYSWENEVWDGDTIEELFYTICGVDRQALRVRHVIENVLAKFWTTIRWVTYADLLAGLCGGSVIPLGRFPYVQPPGHGLPVLSGRVLLTCIHEENMRRGAVHLQLPSDVTVDVRVDTYGHLVEFICYKTLSYLLREHGGNSLARNIAGAFAIRLHIERLTSRSQLLMYYQAQFAGKVP